MRPRRDPVLRVGSGTGAIAPSALPQALAVLHGRLPLDTPVLVRCPPGVGDGVGGGPAALPPDRGSWLADVLCGAGFDAVRIDAGADPGAGAGTGPALMAQARRARSLADRVGPDMRLLVCGLNPSIYAAERGIAFARPGNRFWPAMLAAGLVTQDRDPDDALRRHGIGFTDLVKRATRSAAELAPAELVAGIARVERLVRWLRPAAVCFLGVTGYRLAVDRRATAGPLSGGFAGAAAYLAPNPSGRNATTQLAAMVEHLQRAAQLPI